MTASAHDLVRRLDEAASRARRLRAVLEQVASPSKAKRSKIERLAGEPDDVERLGQAALASIAQAKLADAE